tara:strand:- start:168 stop:554 length:387 start_codon:yes stop_codon:yes gene_type:complete
MTTKYTSLKEMGVTSFDLINKYTLRQEGDFDILKIYYKREKGSFLPRSKKFRFGRATRTVMVDSGRQQWQEVTEISPFLLKVLTELNKLANEEKKTMDSKEEIIDSIVHLERIMTEKLSEIRARVDKI